MKEKTYNSMGFCGVIAIVTGLVVAFVGMAAGFAMIYSGVRLFSDRKDIMI